ncbi:redoxin domain-containing protein [Psychrobacillus sp. FSL W7-1493]|uniref:redoxin domain-containing protein n=1 Tax=Psychrobacillus sp. FSL W7-1493 TaxID=2921552 RepID=UPI0030F50330
MKKIIGLLVIGFLIAIATISFVKNNIDEKEDPFEGEQMGTDMAENPANKGTGKGDSAPDFTLTTLDGKEVSLSDYKGKKVVLNFWTSWCPPCKAEMPHMQNYYEDMTEEDNVEILAVNLTNKDNGLDEVSSFIEDYGLTFPIPMDEEGQVGNAYKIISIPTTYMIDTSGIIQNIIVGPMDEQMMIDYVDKLK